MTRLTEPTSLHFEVRRHGNEDLVVVPMSWRPPHPQGPGTSPATRMAATERLLREAGPEEIVVDDLRGGRR